MKILKLYLENFLGIKHGMNRSSVEIDFTKGENTITMFLGRNGSGKSTIMSQLHPFKDSFDDRKELICDGVDGRKEIEYEHDGHIYKITHVYAKIAQSFISKDGLELNESGGVKTCEEHIRKELGLTKEYFKIGKIGSNTRNFVGFTATERKNYIGTFLNIDDYLKAFKTVKEKFTAIKTSTSDIASKLQNIESEEVLSTKLQLATAKKDQCFDDISKLHVTLGSIESAINTARSNISGLPGLEYLTIKRNQLVEDRDKKKLLIATLDPIFEKESRDKIPELREAISTIQSNIKILLSEIENEKILLSDYEKRFSGISLQIENLGNSDDSKKLLEDITAATDIAKEYQERISKNSRSSLVRDVLSERKDFNRYLSQFVEFTDFLEKYFVELSKCDITQTKTNLEHFMDDDFNDSFERQLHESSKTITAREKLLEDLKSDLAKLEANENQVAVLAKRPLSCKDDTCPFIREALKYINIEKDIEQKRELITATEEQLESLRLKNEYLNDLYRIYKEYISKRENLNVRENNLYQAFFDGNFSNFVRKPLSDFSKNRQEFIDDVSRAHSDFTSYLTYHSKIKNLKLAYDKISGNNDSVKEGYLEEQKSLQEKINAIKLSQTVLSGKHKNLNDELTYRQNVLNDFAAYLQAKDNIDSLNEQIDKFNSDIKTLEENNSVIETNTSRKIGIENRISDLMNEKTSAENDVTDITIKIKTITELKDLLKALKENYTKTQALFNALNPNSGIPLILVQNYLNETEAITNNLLQIAYNGDFSIKFNITDKEFLITVNSKGNIKEDIRIASQGELALTTISISLALIQQATGDYNILCLDEIDGPLDKNNRENFINILNSQISKLGIEQVFVISHNNAFDICPMDLVLLDGNNVNKDDSIFMENKKIIFDMADG